MGNEAKRAIVTAEQIINCLLAEYGYWKDSEDSSIAIGATAAIANVVAFATLPNWKAEWHPEKLDSEKKLKGENL